MYINSCSAKSNTYYKCSSYAEYTATHDLHDATVENNEQHAFRQDKIFIVNETKHADEEWMINKDEN